MRARLRVRCHMYLSRSCIFRSSSDYIDRYRSGCRRLRCLNYSTVRIEVGETSLDSYVDSCLEAQPQRSKMISRVECCSELTLYEGTDDVVDDGRDDGPDLFVNKRRYRSVNHTLDVARNLFNEGFLQPRLHARPEGIECPLGAVFGTRSTSEGWDGPGGRPLRIGWVMPCTGCHP